MVKYLWSDEQAAALTPGLDELVYRSNLIGSDRSVCNWGGGNTSMKTKETDFRGREIDVMWVKGSGSDLATMSAGQFTGLKLDDVRPLIERDHLSDEEMTAYLAHCMIDKSHPRPSIETLFCHFPMLIIHIRMRSSAFAALTAGSRSPKRFLAAVLFGCLMCVRLYFIKNDCRRSQKQS